MVKRNAIERSWLTMTVPIKGGRPKAFNSPEELQEAINEYFEYCDSQKEISINDKGQTKVIQKPYTISGLCVFLDITRETLNEYSKKQEYSDTIKKARQIVESYVEENSLIGRLNPVVSIFNLKNNFGWVDKIEVNTNTGNEQLTQDDIQARISELKKKQIKLESIDNTTIEGN